MSYFIEKCSELENVYKEFSTNEGFAYFNEDMRFNVKLVVYELVSNIIKYSKCSAFLSCELTAGLLRIRVKGECESDCQEILDKITMPSSCDECGRGICIVNRVSDKFFYEDSGKTAVTEFKFDTLEYNVNKVLAETKNVTLVSATKTVDIDRIKKAKELGIEVFAENRVQEFLDKYPHLSDLNWHFIGHLQTNKVKYIVDKVSLIHSVDSYKLASVIDSEACKINKIQNILLQVNIGEEDSKSGFNSDELEENFKEISKLKNVKVVGVMGMMPKNSDKKTNSKYYMEMKKLFDKINTDGDMEYISMGMSDDYIQAIECGSNMVRVGSGIFGSRNY